MGLKIFYDTEFIDTGDELILLSIGLEREDGERYYAEPREADLSEASDWVEEHVLRHLDSWAAWSANVLNKQYESARELYLAKTKPRHQIAEEIVAFVGEDPDFFGYVDHYDWVLLSQLYGPLTERPGGWPWGSVNLAIRAVQLGIEPEHDLPLETELKGFEHLPEHAHRADAGAAWTRRLYGTILHRQLEADQLYL